MMGDEFRTERDEGRRGLTIKEDENFEEIRWKKTKVRERERECTRCARETKKGEKRRIKEKGRRDGEEE